ncbi:hypothetical protein TNCV_4651601 [Trichonephila clavipes]|nr:hypothetical protein TNCV_4651601 [Trichonephila clavipes]
MKLQKRRSGDQYSEHKKSPGRLQTWKNDRKAGGGAYRHQCSCRVRNQQKCHFERLESVLNHRYSCYKVWWWPPEDDNCRGCRIYHPAGEKRPTAVSKRHCSATLYSNGATSVAIYCGQTSSQRGPIRPPS